MRRVEFFIEESKYHTQKEIFGLCDDDNNLPAYIDEEVANKESQWIGEVHNVSKKGIDFYPIDHCVELLHDDMSQAHRCEGLLRYNENSIFFCELKTGRIVPSEWLKDAEEQILETMSFFFDNYNLQSFNTKSWICNKRLTNQNYFKQIAEFKEETKHKFGGRGFVLYISKSIEI